MYASPLLFCLHPCWIPTWPVLLQFFQLSKLVQSSKILLFCDALPSLFLWTLSAHYLYVWSLPIIGKLLKGPSHTSYFPCSRDLGIWVNKFLLQWLLRALGKSLPVFEILVPYLKDKEAKFYQGWWQVCGIHTSASPPWVKADITNWSLILVSHCDQIYI